jgi:hypothetical protein
MLPLHQNDLMQALSQTRALSSISFPLHSYGSLTKQKTERLCSILLFNKKIEWLFYLPNIKYNGFILKNLNGVALF